MDDVVPPELEVVPANASGEPLKNQSHDGTGFPEAHTVKLAALPRSTVWLVGCDAIVGAVVTGLTASVTEFLVAVPKHCSRSKHRCPHRRE